MAPYEIFYIFPINDRIEEIGEEIEKDKGREVELKKELQELLNKWQFRNFGRILSPLVVGVAGMLNIVKKEA